MAEKSLLIESLENHQKLIEVLLSHKNEIGICEVSEQELMVSMNRSLAWVYKAIDRINTEDLCIERIARGRYVVHYDNLSNRGVFSIILKMTLLTLGDVSIVRLKDKDLMQKFGCTLKTVQMYRAYCLTGWKQATKDK